MEPDIGTTNVRNLESAHWRLWTALHYRCVVPFTSFSEFDNTIGPDGKRLGDAWFALDQSRTLAFLAGIWIPGWQGVLKIRKGVENIDLFALLTTEPNDVVGSIYMKAMPVILTDRGRGAPVARRAVGRGEEAKAALPNACRRSWAWEHKQDAA